MSLSHQNMTNEELVVAIKEAKTKKTKDILTEFLLSRNMGLIYAIAHRYQIPGVAFEDKVQDGSIGFIEAIRTYRNGFGSKFSTHAAEHIKSNILHNGNMQANSVRLPPHAISIKVRMNKYIKDCMAYEGRRPTLEEICAELCQSKEQIMHIIDSSGTATTTSIDSPVKSAEGDDMYLHDIMGGDDFEHDLLNKSQFDLVLQFLAELPVSTQLLVKKIIGFGETRPHSLREAITMVAGEDGNMMSYTSAQTKYQNAISYIKNRINGATDEFVAAINSTKNLNLRDVIILVVPSKKIGFITADLKFSQCTPDQCRGHFINQQETFQAAMDINAHILQYELNVQINKVDEVISTAIKELEDEGYSIENKNDFVEYTDTKSRDVIVVLSPSVKKAYITAKAHYTGIVSESRLKDLLYEDAFARGVLFCSDAQIIRYAENIHIDSIEDVLESTLTDIIDNGFMIVNSEVSEIY